MTLDVAALRAVEFPWAGGRGTPIHLNTASTGPLPVRTVALVEDWTRRRMQPWTITDHDTVFPALRAARAACAQLVGADPREIALTSNTSYGLSLAAQALPLVDGDVVVASADEFPTVVAAWRTTQPSRQLHVELVPTRDGWPDEDGLIETMRRTRARALAVSWVGYGHGYRLDLRRLGAACRDMGALFVVDAMQGLGVMPLDVRQCHVDVLACGGFKWLLAPWGAGFAYVRQELIPAMNPPALGWLFGPRQEDYNSGLAFDAPLYADARRFEVMTLPSQDLAALGCSVGLLLEAGLPSIAVHVAELTSRLVAWARAHPRATLRTPEDAGRRAGIVSIAVPDVAAVSTGLRAAGVIHALRQGALRISPHLFNTVDEVDTATSRLQELLSSRTVHPVP